MKKKKNRNSSAGTNANSSTQLIETTSAAIAANPMLCAVLVEDIEETKKLFPWTGKSPEWLKHYLLLIKTRRKGKYYIIKGLSFVGKFRVDGFNKFKVIGYRELS